MDKIMLQRNDILTHYIQHFQAQTNLQAAARQRPVAISNQSRSCNWYVREGIKTPAAQRTFSAALDQATKEKALAQQSQTTRKTTASADYTVQAGDTLWSLAVNKFHVNVEDLAKDNQIDDPDKIQVGQKLTIKKAEPPPPGQVVASWYGKDFHGKTMANGSPYNMYANTIAHKDLPLGTKVELKNPRTGQTITAVVTDRGPYVDGRDVDLSYGVAQRLSMIQNGVDTLVMKVL
ncbi:MAG: septal ring lytic transglycosylase RlpA family protein [Desulfocapsaceae bacterium]|nr:septal ring lytic transglycosylase RlpA family protein [Desulfocapsaceae bacterium]